MRSIFRKFKLINKGQMVSILFVEGTNRRGHDVMGYLDLRDRGWEVVSPFDLHRHWITPTKDDLTFYNFHTNIARSNATKVGDYKEIKSLLTIIFFPKDLSVADDTVSPRTPSNLVFYLSQHDVYLSTSPTEASLFGPAGKCFQVEMES